jgi:AcrR family transcriptional regulator
MSTALPLRQQKKHQARNRILASAERLIRERGFEATTMRDIASRAELSYQTLYNYFPTKGQILEEVLTDRVGQVAPRNREILAAYQGNLLDTLAALQATAFQAVDQDDRQLWRIATIERITAQTTAIPAYRLTDERFRDVLGQLLLEARNTGELSADAHLGRLTGVLFDLADHSLLRFLLDPHATASGTLAHLADQNQLVLGPYLNAGSGGT